MKDINYWAVAVAAFASYAISCVWFLILFRVPYMEGLGKTKEAMDKGPSMLSASIMQVIGNFVMIVVLAYLMKSLGYLSPTQGMLLATYLWMGFVAAVIGPMYAFEAFSFSFFMITTGSVLVSMLVSGLILGLWK